jgi:hypothetical protein
MDVFFSTVVRGAPLGRGGELIKLNWHEKRIIKRIPLVPFDPPIEQDPNPRGNTRGGRGILLRGNYLVVATYHSLHFYDRDLNFQGKISHNLFAGIHELSLDNHSILVSSTAIDAVLAVDERGNLLQSWWPRESPCLQKQLAVSPLPIDKSADNRLRYLDGVHLRDASHLHLNAVANHNGKVFALLARKGIVYNLTDDKILINNRDQTGFHNLVFTDKHILINHTQQKKLMVFTHDGILLKSINFLDFPEIHSIYKKTKSPIGNIIRKVHNGKIGSKFGQIIMTFFTKQNSFLRRHAFSTPIFLRGLFSLENNRALVSFSPATIVELNYKDEKITDLFQYSPKVEVCPHGLMAI